MTFEDRFPLMADGRPHIISWRATETTAGYNHGDGDTGIAVVICHQCWTPVLHSHQQDHSDDHDRQVKP